MIRLDVPHMKSEQCRATIISTLVGVDPTALCDVDMEARRVQVESKFPPTDFIEALEEVGYSSFVAQA